MQKILISIPDDLAMRMRSAIPARKRSEVLTQLIEQEILHREEELKQCALAVEADELLEQEMKAWDTTVSDGINNETW